MGSTTKALSSLQNKVVSFASDIKASVFALCSRLFGLGAPSGAIKQVSFHPASTDYLKAMQDSLVKGDLSGLFRKVPGSSEAMVFETALSKGDSPSLGTVPRDVIASHLKQELGQFKMTAASFETLSDLKDKWLSAPEGDKRKIAKEAVASYVDSLPDTADKKKATVMVQIFAVFAKLAPEDNVSPFNRGALDTCVVPNFMHPEHVLSMDGYMERQASGVQIFDMLMKGVSPLTPIRAPETKLSTAN
ncbi:hypothetical protein C1H71_19700 [Iodobacter fluviatilis]|uniref:Rho-GAP domain-containing protein n=2 Tax=Iodobacter fluviatilis TaxID=537 RepID=A0A7G3GD60_9NEIS|nr:hypothetical protein C1H71_19700 [Iodobacter fluviatilis]